MDRQISGQMDIMKYLQKSKTDSVHHQSWKIKKWKKLLHQSPSFVPFMSDIKVYPVLSDTFIMLHEDYPSQIVTHFDREGKKLFQASYATSEQLTLNVLNEKIVVLLRIREGNSQSGDLDIRIDCIDLESGVQQENQMYLNYPKQQKEELSFFVFRQSELVCVCENLFRTSKNQHATEFIVNFYRLNKASLQLEKILSEQLELPSQNIDYKYKGIKLDQNAMIGFIPHQTINTSVKTIPFYIYDLGDELKYAIDDGERVKSYEFEHGTQGKISEPCGVVIKEMWNIARNTFYLKLESSLDFNKYVKGSWKQNMYESVGVQFQYIWDRKTNTSRAPTYQPPEKHYLVQFIGSLRPITPFKKQILIKNPTQKKVPKSELESIILPVYLVSCFNEHEFLEERIETRFNLRNCYPIFTKDKIINYELDQSSLLIDEIHVKNVDYDKKMIITFVSLQIFPEFEEDLLSMIVELTKD